jgi:hypothetical protein
MHGQALFHPSKRSKPPEETSGGLLACLWLGLCQGGSTKCNNGAMGRVPDAKGPVGADGIFFHLVNHRVSANVYRPFANRGASIFGKSG